MHYNIIDSRQKAAINVSFLAHVAGSGLLSNLPEDPLNNVNKEEGK
jgi:hypothetical protein